MKRILASVRYEYVVKKSTFITLIHAINNEEEVDKKLEQIKKTYKGADHYCYAYIIHQRMKASDDGEPNGTAGIPILEVVKKHHLSNCLVVVIRYFGGIKLGTGGLIRAYVKSVQEALKKAEIVECVHGFTLQIQFTIDKIKRVETILKKYKITRKKYGPNIIYEVQVPLDQKDILVDQLKDLVDIQLHEMTYIE